MHFLERAFDKQNQWWKYLIVFIIAFIAANFIGGIPLFIVFFIQGVKGYASNADNPADLSPLGIDANLGLVLNVFPFIAALFVSILCIRWFHKRSWKEVINGTNKIRWRRFFIGLGLWAFLMAVYTVVEMLLFPEHFVFNFDFTHFFILLIITILFLPFQTTCEEFLFRGYLAQGVAAWTKSRWLAIIIPGILFALLHSSNPEVGQFGFASMMPQYLIFGLTFGLISILDDGIEISMGVHAANNMFLCLFITQKDSALVTHALFEEINITQSFILIDGLFLLIMSCVIVWLLARKYKWNFSILNKRIKPDTPVSDQDIKISE